MSKVFVLLFGQNKTKLPICLSRVKQSISNNRTERKNARTIPESSTSSKKGTDKHDKQKR